MRHIAYEGRRVEVEIVSLVHPRTCGLMGPQHPAPAENANLTFLSPIEIPIGAHFQLDAADEPALEVRVLGCAPAREGCFVVLGLVEGP